MNKLVDWSFSSACLEWQIMRAERYWETFTLCILEIEKYSDEQLSSALALSLRQCDLASKTGDGRKALGVTISIDDFGTEYSSLSRLREMPIDRIKMAMHFVHGISSNQKDEAIASVIVNLSRNLKLGVIAEGVETNAQLDFLAQRMCDEVQGYYIYKREAIPAEEVEQILKNAKVHYFE